MNCTCRKGIPVGLAVLLSGLGAAYAGGVDAPAAIGLAAILILFMLPVGGFMLGCVVGAVVDALARDRRGRRPLEYGIVGAAIALVLVIVLVLASLLSS